MSGGAVHEPGPKEHKRQQLKDKKDKLTSTLFMKKLEFLFEEEHNQLHRCVNCGALYTGN